MASIRTTREELSNRLPVLSFSIRTDGEPFFEVALAGDPSLFGAVGKDRRRPSNFYSTRAEGLLHAGNGEAMYLVPPAVLHQLAGNDRLYYALATFTDISSATPSRVLTPNENSHYVGLGSFSGQSMRRIPLMGGGGLTGSDNLIPPDGNLLWAGDLVAQNPQSPQNGAPGKIAPTQPQPPGDRAVTGQGADFIYDDGFGPMAEKMSWDQDDGYGIEGPIPDDLGTQTQGLVPAQETTFQPEYPQASRFMPADPSNYRQHDDARAINRIVIHITDGGPNINGPISWFQNPEANVSSHYIIGRDGEVVQMVRHDDVAWHARSANGDSIGIEHVANTKGLNPTEAEYCASANLVRWLCGIYDLPLDRVHIVGHAEADTETNHRGCPDAVWDWNYYMGLVQSGAGDPSQLIQGMGWGRYDGPMGLPMTAAPLGENRGIEGPIPGQLAQQAPSASQAYAMTVQPEYPLASRFVAAHSSNYRQHAGPRSINCIVIHITDGGANINGTISWFQNPKANVSAHYIVGQDGDVVQMVHHDDVAWHAGSANGDSIGIEHVANTKGLNPTETQYCESAALVGWLCEQYGIPKDRDHILGHSEADPNTTHTGCPNAVWDWDYFMDMVKNSYCRPQTLSSQGLPSTPARPFTTLAGSLAKTCSYTPTDTDDALRQLQQLSQQTHGCWTAGVRNTSFYPHSAICQLKVTSTTGNVGFGTGFYVAPDLILTCAHNIEIRSKNFTAASIEVTPGKNGTLPPAGNAFTVPPGSWFTHPQYTDKSFDFDLAVICTDVRPPNGDYFDILEEQRLSPIYPIIMCGYSSGTAKIDVQNLDGDHIREVLAETFTYKNFGKPGSSGGPVLYVDNTLQCRVTGVNVAGAAGIAALGCRLTDSKILWISQHAKTNILAPLSQGISRPMSGASAIVGTIAGAGITRILNNSGDITWKLEQLNGLKHPNDDESYQGKGEFQNANITVPGPHMALGGGLDEIYANGVIRFQYNGHSVGNVQISITDNNDALGAGLEITASIMNDARTYSDNGGGPYAALDVQFQYRFTNIVYNDVILFTDYKLFGNGTHSVRYRWNVNSQSGRPESQTVQQSFA